jgi:CRISPR-associated endonuclease/helicase Cas3
LLAPFGVGTIDQALLAVLQTKHVFVRLFGLSGKTVILDEVHAYDAYMSTLMERLIEWLAALGCSVVLLSATLSASKRRRLLEKYAGKPLDFMEAPYPRMTVLRDGEAHSVPIEVLPDRRIEVALARLDRGELPLRLRTALADGGCAAVIRNTVKDAQETYLCLRDALRPCGIEVELFHARFPFGQRDRIEKRVLARYGKPGDAVRPKAAVLVATQVIEQSLDLDFDLLVSDLAPVDLVLQRMGRVHRHQRPSRPAAVAAPAVWLLRSPLDANGIPDFGPSRYVYDRHILFRSYLAIDTQTSIRLPGDIESLVETVYGGSIPPVPSDAWRQALETSREELEASQRESQRVARACLIKPPTWEDDILEDFCQQLDEDNPEVHRTLRAATRLTEETASVVLLHRIDGAVFCDAGGKEPADLGREPDLTETRRLLRCVVGISHRGCYHALVKLDPPSTWRDNAMLRHHRLVELEGGQVTLDSYILRLDAELGIVIDKAGHEGGDEP